MGQPVEEAPRDPTVEAVVEVAGDDYDRAAGAAANPQVLRGQEISGGGYGASAQRAQEQESERWDLQTHLSVLLSPRCGECQGLGRGEWEAGGARWRASFLFVGSCCW